MPPGPGEARFAPLRGRLNVPSRTLDATCSWASRNGTPCFTRASAASVASSSGWAGAALEKPLTIDLEPAHQHREGIERKPRVTPGREHGRLVLLEIAVVREREPLHGRQEAREPPDRCPGLSAGELGDVRIQLLRHHRRP